VQQENQNVSAGKERPACHLQIISHFPEGLLVAAVISGERRRRRYFDGMMYSGGMDEDGVALPAFPVSDLLAGKVFEIRLFQHFDDLGLHADPQEVRRTMF
jgi:hypothetical protein